MGHSSADSAVVRGHMTQCKSSSKMMVETKQIHLKITFHVDHIVASTAHLIAFGKSIFLKAS